MYADETAWQQPDPEHQEHQEVVSAIDEEEPHGLPTHWQEASNGGHAPPHRLPTHWQEASNSSHAPFPQVPIPQALYDVRPPGRPRKDPSAPRRPLGAAEYYLAHRKAEAIRNGESNRMPFRDLVAIHKQEWRALPAAARAPFEASARADRQRYGAEMANYVPPPGIARPEVPRPEIPRSGPPNVADKYVTKSGRLKKDPNRPKPPRSAYFCFMELRRPSVMESSPGLAVPDITRILAQEWKALDEAGRQPYAEMAQADRQRYEAEMLAYQPRGEYSEQQAKSREARRADAAGVRRRALPVASVVHDAVDVDAVAALVDVEPLHDVDAVLMEANAQAMAAEHASAQAMAAEHEDAMGMADETSDIAVVRSALGVEAEAVPIDAHPMSVEAEAVPVEAMEAMAGLHRAEPPHAAGSKRTHYAPTLEGLLDATGIVGGPSSGEEGSAAIECDEEGGGLMLLANTDGAPLKRPRGRPKGSKNKPKYPAFPPPSLPLPGTSCDGDAADVDAPVRDGATGQATAQARAGTAEAADPNATDGGSSSAITKRGPGRPKGSTNAPRELPILPSTSSTTATPTDVTAAAAAAAAAASASASATASAAAAAAAAMAAAGVPPAEAETVPPAAPAAPAAPAPSQDAPAPPQDAPPPATELVPIPMEVTSDEQDSTAAGDSADVEQSAARPRRMKGPASIAEVLTLHFANADADGGTCHIYIQ